MAELIQLPRHSVVPLVLRRMRAPLLVLISAYAIAVLGLVLIPGEGPGGQPYGMDFLHAFYVISYTATTIGFGELPYAFTPGQRLWMTLSIYLVVISWFYAIGTIIGLIRDPVFQRAVTWNRFRRSVHNLGEPFYLVCGYGDTGSQLVQEITETGGRAVVIDHEEGQTNLLSVESLRSYVPSLCADANVTDNLLAGGLTNRDCRALLAVTDDDHTNLQIAITAKLLNPNLPVIARAENEETRGNMASFGTDHIVDPFDTFAGGFVMAMESPYAHRMVEWLSAKPEIPLTSETLPPRGRWIVCGYGRLGRALHRRLSRYGLELVIISQNLDDLPTTQSCIVGKGTEEHTLRAAGIEDEEVVGVIAATDDDADNLSIVMTARAIAPDKFLVARQNDRAKKHIFEAARLDMIMEPSGIMALRMLRLLATPMLPHFIRLLRRCDDQEVGRLLEEFRERIGAETPAVWTVTLVGRAADAVVEGLVAGWRVTIRDLLRDPRRRDDPLPAEVLMIQRKSEYDLLPAPDEELRVGDRLLLCGHRSTVQRIDWTLNNVEVFRYVMTGEQRPDGTVWRWIARKRARAVPIGESET